MLWVNCQKVGSMLFCSRHTRCINQFCPSVASRRGNARQDKTAILGEISPIFRSFSAYFPPMVPHLPFLSLHVYGIRLFSSIFRLFSA